MQGKSHERWQVLCQQAATEQDPERLMDLIHEINQLLNEKEERLRRMRKESTVSYSFSASELACD